MKLEKFKLFLYGVLLLISVWITLKLVDSYKFSKPEPKTVFGMQADVLYALPIVVLLLIYFFSRWMSARSLSNDTGKGTPVAILFSFVPLNTNAYMNHDPRTARGMKFIWYVNAFRGWKEKHKGDRIISIYQYDEEEEKRYKQMIKYPYLYEDRLSHEEIVRYVYERGTIEIAKMNWFRKYISGNPKFLDVGNIQIVEMRGLPTTPEEMASSLAREGYIDEAKNFYPANQNQNRFGERQ